MSRRLTVAACIAALGATGGAALASKRFDGTVIGVTDGDTLTVLVVRTPVRVRLAEINAPDNGQEFGERSRQALANLCMRQWATVHVIGTDHYGRTVGRVQCRGQDASTDQVRYGMAWVSDRYATDDSLNQLQQDARDARIGLWRHPNPIPPWRWRRPNTIQVH